MTLISKEALIKFFRGEMAKSHATIPQISYSRLIKYISEMDCIEIPMTESTYRGKHEVTR